MKTASSYSLGCPELSSGCVGTTNEKTQSFRGATPRQNSLCANLLILKGGDIAASINHPENGVRMGLRRSPRPRPCCAAKLCKSLIFKGGDIAAAFYRWWAQLPPPSLTNNEAQANHLGFVVSGVRK